MQQLPRSGHPVYGDRREGDPGFVSGARSGDDNVNGAGDHQPGSLCGPAWTAAHHATGRRILGPCITTMQSTLDGNIHVVTNVRFFLFVCFLSSAVIWIGCFCVSWRDLIARAAELDFFHHSFGSMPPQLEVSNQCLLVPFYNGRK